MRNDRIAAFLVLLCAGATAASGAEPHLLATHAERNGYAAIHLLPSVWEHVRRELPRAMTLRRRTIEHVFGTLKHWMGSTHFLTRGLPQVSTEMSLHVLAYNLKRVIQLLGMAGTMKAMRLVGT
jgi:Transposase DDE domain